MSASDISARNATPDSVWGITSYRWWFGADSCGALGRNIALFAMPLIVLGASGSEGLAGLFSALLIALQTVFGVAGGVLQDRYDRRLLMVLNGVVVALVMASAWTIDVLWGLSWPVLVALAVVLGVQAGLLGGTSNAMLRGIVPDHLLANAMTANSARDSVVHLSSGPAAGILMALGRAFPLLASAILGVLEAVTASQITSYWRRAKDGDKPGMKQAFGGLSWVLTHSFQRRVMLVSVIAAGAGNTFLFITVLVISNSGSQPVLAGVVNGGAAVGMLMGAALAQRIIQRIPSGRLVLAMIAVMSIGFVVAAVVDNIWIRAVLVAVALIPLPAGGAVLTSFFNVIVSKDKLGRVSAAQQLLTFGTLALLTLVAGWVLEGWGYQVAALFLAMLMAVSFGVAWATPALRKIPVPTRWAEHIAAMKIVAF